MLIEKKYRQALGDARRIVIKVGSRVIVQKTGRPDTRRMRALVAQVAAMRRDGYEVLLVTSGAVGAGMEALKLRERPGTVPELQMCAAIGQTRLMAQYAGFFAKERIIVGQVLLTHSDFLHKVRLSNARRTLEHLLRAKVLPVINENDVVADEEIRADLALGDNDYLAALVVKLVRADLLVLLTTVDGLRSSVVNGRTKRVRIVETVTPRVLAHVTPGANTLSKGGMASKLKAAQMAAKAGCSTVIANGREDDVLTGIMAGKSVGTMILASGT